MIWLTFVVSFIRVAEKKFYNKNFILVDLFLKLPDWITLIPMTNVPEFISTEIPKP